MMLLGILLINMKKAVMGASARPMTALSVSKPFAVRLDRHLVCHFDLPVLDL